MTPAEAVTVLGSWPYIAIFCGVSFGLGMLFQSRCTRARYSRHVLKLSDEVGQSLSNPRGMDPQGVAARVSTRVWQRPEHPAHGVEDATARGARFF